MKKLKVTRIHLLWTLAALIFSFIVQQPVSASPFGQGLFGADVPFGSGSSLEITLGNTLSFTLTPSLPYFNGNGSHTINVKSNDVVGYKLYAYSPSGTTMSSGSDTIPTSGNGSPAPLSTNTWGYNTTGSTTDFMGMTTSPVVIRDADGPFKNGQDTTITYGVKTDINKQPGAYQVNVIYTALAENQ